MGLTSRDKTHCVNGHRRTPQNLYVRPSSGVRACRICRAVDGVARNKKRDARRLKARLEYEAKRPFKKPPVRELSWAAGCFEGEGTVSIVRGGARNLPQSRVQLGNTDRDVVDFYIRRWGGRTRLKPANTERARPCFVWVVESRNMRWFLRDILPFIQRSIVREKIQLVLDVDKARVAAPKAPATRRLVKKSRRRMLRLNRRGR